MNQYNRNNPSPEEVFRRFRENFQGSGPTGYKPVLFILGIFLGLVLIFTSFYTVDADEEAVVLRFGQYNVTTGPGLHFKIPFGIDRAIRLRTKEVKQQEFGFRTLDTSGDRTRYSVKGFETESLMLTGDLNVADVSWVVQYKVSDPEKYLFNAKDPQRNIRDVSMAIMRRVVGDRLLNDVLNIARAEISSEAMTGIQGILDQYDIGVRIEGVKLQDVVPPRPVQPSFNEVNAAKQEQEALINQAERRYNSVIPKARGEAEQRISEAEGFAMAVVNRAKGDADRFSSVLSGYRVAPSITRKRIYIETMEELLGKFKNVTIVDDRIKGLLPIYQGMMGGRTLQSAENKGAN